MCERSGDKQSPVITSAFSGIRMYSHSKLDMFFRARYLPHGYKIFYFLSSNDIIDTESDNFYPVFDPHACIKSNLTRIILK